MLFRTGSPLLKNSRFSEVSASYTFLPNNHFSLTAFANYMGNCKRVVTTYSQYDGGNALIQSYINSGTFTNVKAGFNATLRLLHNSLVFQISPAFNHYHSSGYFNGSWNPFTCDVYGQYYFGNFNATAYYSTRARTMNGQTLAKTTNRSYYTLSIGWTKDAWNLSVNASNIFTSRYDGIWSDITTTLYSNRSTSFNGNYRISVMLSATYTFGYGKKIQRGDEVSRQSDAGSAIMQ